LSELASNYSYNLQLAQRWVQFYTTHNWTQPIILGYDLSYYLEVQIATKAYTLWLYLFWQGYLLSDRSQRSYACWIL